MALVQVWGWTPEGSCRFPGSVAHLHLEACQEHSQGRHTAHSPATPPTRVPRHSGSPPVAVGEMFRPEGQRWITAILPPQDFGPAVSYPPPLLVFPSSRTIPLSISEHLPGLTSALCWPPFLCSLSQEQRNSLKELPPLTVSPSSSPMFLFTMKRGLFLYE